LRELHLRNNRLTTLPESLGGLEELRQIDLRGNPLTHLPASLAAAPRLEKLDLRWVGLDPPSWFADLEARGCVIYR
jgi:Leucine-rich repeat (LRR) protein